RAAAERRRAESCENSVLDKLSQRRERRCLLFREVFPVVHVSQLEDQDYRACMNRHQTLLPFPRMSTTALMISSGDISSTFSNKLAILVDCPGPVSCSRTYSDNCAMVGTSNRLLSGRLSGNMAFILEAI